MIQSVTVGCWISQRYCVQFLKLSSARLICRRRRPTMTRVGNQTNSTDPHAINSRVFVGNLNTYLVAKEEVEKIFQRYGRIIGISMHKGYGFVQFTNVWDARNAVMGEDGRTVAGQVLDVNMVLEPKPHQVVKKRTNNHLPNHPPNYLCGPQMTPPLKRPRTDLMGFQLTPKPRPKMIKMENTSHPVFQSRVYHPSDLDILICGNCKEQFPGLQNLIQHKKSTCKLRFSCRCHMNGAMSNAPKSVICAMCQTNCAGWWELVHHVQSTHGISIYLQTNQETNTPPTNQDDSTNTANLTPSTSDGGKACSSCGSDTQSGLVENDWGLATEGDDNEEDAIAHFPHNHVVQKYAEKAVDTADLKQMTDQG